MAFAQLTLIVAIVACGDQPPAEPPAEAAVDSFKPDAAWKPLGPSLWFDGKGRRLVLRAKVVFREGPLEHLLCLSRTKEHESILSTPAPAINFRAGLMLTRADAGRPVRFIPKYEPPTGSAIAITLEWDDQGKTRKVDAREWVMDVNTKKALATDWVFAGSEFVKDPISKEEFLAANDGDYVTVANFASSILDLPFPSTSNDADRGFIAFTERIPPKGTAVTMTFQPRNAGAPASAEKETKR